MKKANDSGTGIGLGWVLTTDYKNWYDRRRFVADTYQTEKPVFLPAFLLGVEMKKTKDSGAVVGLDGWIVYDAD